MKTLIATVLLIAAFTANGQTNYLYYNNNRILEADFLFSCDGYYYFEKNDTIYKLRNSEDLKFIGSIQELPPTTAFEDLYTFTKKGRTSDNLYLLGFISMTGSSIFLLTDQDNDGIGIALATVGVGFSICGFFTNMSGWKYGERAGVKLSAIDYHFQ